jgi:type III restriction enzyme
LFPQLRAIARQYVAEKVDLIAPATHIDAGLSPYYGWILEQLLQAIHPDESEGEAPELPIYEANRGLGSTAEVDFWTSRDVREVVRSHVNYVVADTKKWEQSAAYVLDTHPAVAAFAKNAGLGLSIPYLHNGESHDYVPDFLIRLVGDGERYCILETKGFDPLADVKRASAERWVSAVNADARHGQWRYALARDLPSVPRLLDELR